MKKLDSILNNKKVQIAFIVISVLFLTVFAVRHYVRHVKGYADESFKIVRVITECMRFDSLDDGSIIKQEFAVDESFQGFSIRMGALQPNVQGKMIVTLMDNNQKEIYSWSYQLKDMCPMDFVKFSLPKDCVTTKGTYCIVCNIKKDRNGDFVFYHTPLDVKTEWNCNLNGIDQDWDIEFNVFKNNTTHYYRFIVYFYWAFFVITCFLMLFTFFIFVKGKGKIETIFSVYMLVFGILYMLLLPPYSAPDEPVHYGTAYNVSNLLSNNGSVNANVVMRIEDVNTSYVSVPHMDTYDYTFKKMFAKSKNSEMIEVADMKLGVSNHTTHLLGGIGIFIGRTLGLGNVSTMYLGRLLNLIFYTVVVLFTIRIAPFGKMVFFIISIIPMMLELVSSYSYDAFINPIAFLTIAFILKCIYEISEMRKRDIIGLVILAVLLGPCKIIYSFIFILCIFIPKAKYKKKLYYWLTLGGICMGLVLPNLYYNFAIIQNLISPPRVEQSADVSNNHDNSGIEVESDTSTGYYTVSWSIQHPLDTMKLFGRTSIENTKTYVLGLLGYWLGWLEIGLNSYVIIVMGILLMLQFMEQNEYVTKIKVSHRIMVILVFLIVYLLIHASMLYGWTPANSNVIQGVQGRYFLPVLPIFVILLSCKKIKIPKTIRMYSLVVFVMMQFVVITQIMLTVCQR